MSDTPRVDIVVRTKNRPQFLARALDDILAQEYSHWQLIVVNDGGDPVQAEVARRPGLEGRVTLLDLPESLGRGGAVMPGIEAGHAPYIAIHDDDDTWHPRFLTRTTQHLRSTDDVAVSVRTLSPTNTTGNVIVSRPCTSRRKRNLRWAGSMGTAANISFSSDMIPRRKGMNNG